MDSSKIIILPEELRNSPKDIKKAYTDWKKMEEVIDNHKLRWYVCYDKKGDPIRLDCKGISSQNIIRLHKKGVYNDDWEKELKYRHAEVQKLQTKKGQLSRTFNQYIVGSKNKIAVLDFKKIDILEEFGKYKNIDQVQALIKEWGYNISRGKLKKFHDIHLADIQDRRVHFTSQSKDFYLATETGRIESLSYLYSELLKQFDKTKNVKYASEVRAVIEQVRKEIKGDEVRLTVDGKIDITASIQANRTLQELNQKMPINLFIIGLVAAKKSINPGDLMSQLGNSFYSRYNGFNAIADEDDDFKLPSHFINNYDWQEIEQIHKDKEDRATKTVLERKVKKFFKENKLEYKGNLNDSIRSLEQLLRHGVTPEIVDVKPIEIEVIEEMKPEINNKRELLRELLEGRKKIKE